MSGRTSVPKQPPSYPLPTSRDYYRYLYSIPSNACLCLRLNHYMQCWKIMEFDKCQHNWTRQWITSKMSCIELYQLNGSAIIFPLTVTKILTFWLFKQQSRIIVGILVFWLLTLFPSELLSHKKCPLHWDQWQAIDKCMALYQLRDDRSYLKPLYSSVSTVPLSLDLAKTACVYPYLNTFVHIFQKIFTKQNKTDDWTSKVQGRPPWPSG